MTDKETLYHYRLKQAEETLYEAKRMGEIYQWSKEFTVIEHDCKEILINGKY